MNWLGACPLPGSEKMHKWRPPRPKKNIDPELEAIQEARKKLKQARQFLRGGQNGQEEE